MEMNLFLHFLHYDLSLPSVSTYYFPPLCTMYVHTYVFASTGGGVRLMFWNGGVPIVIFLIAIHPFHSTPNRRRSRVCLLSTTPLPYLLCYEPQYFQMRELKMICQDISRRERGFHLPRSWESTWNVWKVFLQLLFTDDCRRPCKLASAPCTSSLRDDAEEFGN
jgi:hypothetical protein